MDYGVGKQGGKQIMWAMKLLKRNDIITVLATECSCNPEWTFQKTERFTLNIIQTSGVENYSELSFIVLLSSILDQS